MVALRIPAPCSSSQEDGCTHASKPATPLPLNLSLKNCGELTQPQDDNSIPAVQNGFEGIDITHGTFPEEGEEQHGFEERDHSNLRSVFKEGGRLHGSVVEEQDKLPTPSNESGTWNLQNGSLNVESMHASIQAGERHGKFFTGEAVLACTRLEDANHTSGCMGKGRVKWSDSYGKELVHVLEFETSDTCDSDEEDNYTDSHTCSCTIQ